MAVDGDVICDVIRTSPQQPQPGGAGEIPTDVTSDVTRIPPYKC